MRASWAASIFAVVILQLLETDHCQAYIWGPSVKVQHYLTTAVSDYVCIYILVRVQQGGRGGRFAATYNGFCDWGPAHCGYHGQRCLHVVCGVLKLNCCLLS